MLNATYEPICVVAIRRAVVLVLTGKAEAVHATDRSFHSEHLTVVVPTVVRLRTYRQVPRRRPASLSRRAVLVRDGHRCQYCGDRAESIDHVVPRSRGGHHAWENVVAACRLCNARKRDQLLDETSMRLHRHPAPAPPAVSMIAAGRSIPAAWADYLPAPV